MTLTVKQRILLVWGHGAPDDPDELVNWLQAYYPDVYKTETVARRARELRSRILRQRAGGSRTNL